MPPRVLPELLGRRLLGAHVRARVAPHPGGGDCCGCDRSWGGAGAMWRASGPSRPARRRLGFLL
eukprot:scaffold3154_cov133-Isochrysis_galbana.AAC.2